MNKTDFKVEKKVKGLEVILTYMNYMPYQNNYVKTWNEIKKDISRWDQLQLSLMVGISVMMY